MANEKGSGECQRDLLDNPTRRALGAQHIDNGTFKFVDEGVVASIDSGRRPQLSNKAGTQVGNFWIERSTSRHTTLPVPSQMPFIGASR